MSSADRTPADLVITPRDMMFGRGDVHPRWWFGGDPISTTFFNALSLTFPLGEAFFIESVRHYRQDAPERLKAQVGAFMKQEGAHSREHVEFNRHVTDAGYDLSTLETRLAARLQERRSAGKPLISLAATVALEHFTAILAHAWLADDRQLEGMPPEILRLWQWHAIEEVEHKAVAYDTFLHASRHLPAYKRWLLRNLVMLRVTGRFMHQRVLDMRDLFQQDGINTARTWLSLTHYLFVKPGLLRKIIGPWFAFFKPGFHPWDHDDRALIDRAQADLPTEPVAV